MTNCGKDFALSGVTLKRFCIFSKYSHSSGFTWASVWGIEVHGKTKRAFAISCALRFWRAIFRQRLRGVTSFLEETSLFGTSHNYLQSFSLSYIFISHSLVRSEDWRGGEKKRTILILVNFLQQKGRNIFFSQYFLLSECFAVVSPKTLLIWWKSSTLPDSWLAHWWDFQLVPKDINSCSWESRWKEKSRSPGSLNWKLESITLEFEQWFMKNFLMVFPGVEDCGASLPYFLSWRSDTKTKKKKEKKEKLY